MSRRSPFVFEVSVRRSADLVYRSTLFRIWVLSAFVVVLFVAGGTWWAWAVCGLAFLGVYQASTSSWYLLHDRVPREPIARWGYQSAVEGMGRNTVNASGLLEGAAALLLGLTSVWGTESATGRLTLLALAVLWSASVFSCVFLDSAFYNPNIEPSAALEALRSLAGPLLAAIAMLLAYVRPWPADLAWIPVLVCWAALGLTVRVRETDRLLGVAATQAALREEAGRDLVLAQVHSMLSGPADVALVLSRSHRERHPELYEQARIIRSRMQELTALEDRRVNDARLPGSLARPAAGVAAPYGAIATTAIDVASLTEEDHDLARILIGDLVSNAAKEGAYKIDVSLTRELMSLQMSISDDRGDFPEHSWRRPGSSLDRLGRLLEARGGSLTMTTSSAGSVVTAVWLETREGRAS